VRFPVRCDDIQNAAVAGRELDTDARPFAEAIAAALDDPARAP